MSVSITQVTDAALRDLGNIPLNETVYTAGQVETRIGSITGSVADAIASAVSTAWKAGGSINQTQVTAESTTTTFLKSDNEGRVYNATTDITTSDKFVEGSGVHVEVGTDIAVVNTASSGQTAVYKFTVLGVTDSSVVHSVRLSTTSGTPLTPTNGEVVIPDADAMTNGLMPSWQYTKLSGIAEGAEVNQNAFSTVAAGGASCGIFVESGSISAYSKTDTVRFAGDGVIGVDVSGGGGGDDPFVLLSHAENGPDSGAVSKGDTSNQTPTWGDTFKVTSATVDKYGHVTAFADHTVAIPGSVAVADVPGQSCGANGLMSSEDKARLDALVGGAITSAYIDTNSGTQLTVEFGALIIPKASGASYGSCGIVGVVEITDSVTGDSSVVPTAAAVSGAIAGIQNFSQVNVLNYEGNVISCGTIVPSGVADSGFGIKAGENVVLDTSGKNVVISAIGSVTGAKTSGASSNYTLSGSTIVVPVATDSVKGVVEIAASISETGAVVPTAAQVSGALAGKVGGSALHTALTSGGLDKPVAGSYSGNTLYALLSALHSVDGQSHVGSAPLD